MQPFHLAIAVNDLDESRKFYADFLGCNIGRSSTKWIDFDFFGHQLSVHLKPEETSQAKKNEVDGKSVPVKHFGIVLDWNNWLKMAKELEEQNMEFIIEPYIRFEGQPGEQATMFFYDPSGNALEFKSFKNPAMLFAGGEHT